MQAKSHDSTFREGILRADLLAAPRHSGGRRYWLIHDPLRASFTRLTQRDFATLRSGKPISGELARSARAAGLLVGRGKVAASRSRWLENPLYIRCGAVRARWLIEFLTAAFGWVFAGPAVAVGITIILIAAAVAWTSLPRLLGSMPAFEHFFSAGNGLALVVVLAVTKILHEFAHAIVCRRGGAECREIGLLLLCFTPCLYCDVTDAWRLPRRRSRAAVIAAGIYVELLLASLALLVWTQTSPGPVHYLCLNVVIVCGVSSLIFNGNPLMRYDGYYLLSDLIDVPNLRVEAAQAWQRSVLRLTGVKQHLPLRDIGLSTYFVASGLYRTMALVLIGIACIAFLRGIGLGAVGYLFAFSVATMALVRGMKNVAAWCRGLGPWATVPTRFRVTFTFAGLVFAAALLLTPLPHRISATGTIEPAASRTLFAPTTGVLTRLEFRPGAPIQKGQPLAQFSAPQLDRQCIELEGRIEETELEIAGIEQQAYYDTSVLELLETKQATLTALRSQLVLLNRQRSRLVVRAPIDGIVIPPLGVQTTIEDWLSRFETGNAFPAGFPLCRIAAPGEKSAILKIGEERRQYIEAGAPVRLAARQSPTSIFQGVVSGVSEIESDANSSIPSTRHIAIRCAVPEAPASLVAGSEVNANIHVGRRSLVAHLVYLFRSSWQG